MLSTIGIICSMSIFILFQYAVNYWNYLLNVNLHLSISRMIIRTCFMMIFPFFIIIMFMISFHVSNSFQQFQTIQFMIFVRIMFSEILHQKFGVIKSADIHVFLFNLSLDMLSFFAEIHINVLMSWFILSMFWRNSLTWSWLG